MEDQSQYVPTEEDLYENYPPEGNESSNREVIDSLVEFSGVVQSLLRKVDLCNLKDLDDDVVGGHVLMTRLEDFAKVGEIRGAHNKAYNDFITDFYQLFAEIDKKCYCSPHVVTVIKAGSR